MSGNNNLAHIYLRPIGYTDLVHPPSSWVIQCSHQEQLDCDVPADFVVEDSEFPDAEATMIAEGDSVRTKKSKNACSAFSDE